MFIDVDACIRLAKNQASQHSRMTQEESSEYLALTEELWMTSVLGWVRKSNFFKDVALGRLTML